MSRMTDEQLLAALAERMDERRSALKYAADSLRDLRVVNGKLEAAEAIQSHFLSNIRNEINNPLSALQGLSALIVSNPGLKPEQVREMVGLIHREICGLSFQMQNLFAAAELEAGDVEPHWEAVDVTTLAARVTGDFRLRAAQKRVAVVLLEQESVPTMTITDPGKLTAILVNLLANAVEFSPESSFVEVRLSNTDEELLLEVRDNGPGISPENRLRVFDRFEQLSTGTTRVHAGHGIGLSVVKAYAEILGGRIELFSENGKGSLFSLHLPLKNDPSAVVSPDEEFFFEGAETY